MRFYAVLAPYVRFASLYFAPELCTPCADFAGILFIKSVTMNAQAVCIFNCLTNNTLTANVINQRLALITRDFTKQNDNFIG